jgi:hypothetical protein
MRQETFATDLSVSFDDRPPILQSAQEAQHQPKAQHDVENPFPPFDSFNYSGAAVNTAPPTKDAQSSFVSEDENGDGGPSRNPCILFLLYVWGIAVALAIIVIFVFYGAFYCIYKFLGIMAGCCKDQSKLCNHSSEGTNSRAAPCSCCFRLLCASQCYLFFFGFGGIAYAFYILSLGPLWLLSFLNETYKKDFAESKFTLKFDDEELEHNQSDRAAVVVPGSPQRQPHQVVPIGGEVERY